MSKKHTNKHKHYNILAIIVFVVALVGFSALISRTGVHAKEFVGVIKETDLDKITLQGLYLVPDDNMLQLNRQNQVSVQVKTNTKYVKTLVYYPTQEELEQNPKADRRSQNVEGSLEELTSSKTEAVFAKSSQNIFGKQHFIADEIRYVWTVYPGQEN